MKITQDFIQILKTNRYLVIKNSKIFLYNVFLDSKRQISRVQRASFAIDFTEKNFHAVAYIGNDVFNYLEENLGDEFELTIEGDYKNGYFLCFDEIKIQVAKSTLGD